eukprot:g23615.t1
MLCQPLLIALRKGFFWNFKELFRQGALYRALPTALVGAVPKAVIHYSILNLYINTLAPDGDMKKADGQTATVIGMATGASETVLVNPINFVKFRMQRPEWGYSGMVDAIQTIYRVEGLQAFWKGAGAVFVRNTICNGGMVGGYKFTEKALSSSADLPDGPRHLLAGACGGIVGSFVSYPFEMLRAAKMHNISFMDEIHCSVVLPEACSGIGGLVSLMCQPPWPDGTCIREWRAALRAARTCGKVLLEDRCLLGPEIPEMPLLQKSWSTLLISASQCVFRRRIVINKEDYFGMAADGLRNFDLWNVAHVAAYHDDLKLLSLATLEQCKEPNRWGMTPMHMTGLGQHPYGPSLCVLWELIQLGAADPEALNSADQSAWHIAQRMQKPSHLKKWEKVVFKGVKPDEYEARKQAQLRPRGKFARALGMEPVQREERASKMFENKSGTAFQATIPTQRYACASDAFRVRRKDTSKPLPVCLVFPGQGSQYVGMLRQQKDGPQALLRAMALTRFCLYGLGAHRVEVEVVDGKKHFVVRTNALSGLPVRHGFERYGGDAYFSEDWRPVMIVDQGRGDLVEDFHQKQFIARPGDEEWERTKFRFRSSLFSLVTMVDHLYFVHLQLANLFVTSLREQMSESHPIRRFMTPFTYQTISINDNAAHNLVAPRTMGPRCFALTDKGFELAFSAAPSLQVWGYEVPKSQGGPCLHLKDYFAYKKSTGVDTEYFRQASQLYDIFCKFVTSYLECYYAKKEDLVQDQELVAMAQHYFARYEANALRSHFTDDAIKKKDGEPPHAMFENEEDFDETGGQPEDESFFEDLSEEAMVFYQQAKEEEEAAWLQIQQGRQTLKEARDT